MSTLSLETNELVEKTTPDRGFLIRNNISNYSASSADGSSSGPHFGDENNVSLKNTFNAAGDKIKLNDSQLEFFLKKQVTASGLIGLTEGVNLLSWKRVANISSKILYFDDKVVQIECLVDKENRIYEQRQFGSDFFEGLKLEIGYIFKLCFYKRNNQQMVEVMYDSNLVASDDFSSTDFLDDVNDLITDRIID